MFPLQFGHGPDTFKMQIKKATPPLSPSLSLADILETSQSDGAQGGGGSAGPDQGGLGTDLQIVNGYNIHEWGVMMC